MVLSTYKLFSTVDLQEKLSRIESSYGSWIDLGSFRMGVLSRKNNGTDVKEKSYGCENC